MFAYPPWSCWFNMMWAYGPTRTVIREMHEVPGTDTQDKAVNFCWHYTQPCQMFNNVYGDALDQAWLPEEYNLGLEIQTQFDVGDENLHLE